MGRFYDISNRMDNSKADLKIDDEHIFKINRHMAVGLKINDIYKDDKLSEKERLEQTIKLALGKEAYEYIESLNLNQPSYEAIINVIMAAIGDITLEQLEEEGKKEKNKKK